jgi:hypothetical protein
MHFREMVNNKHHFRFIVGCQPTFPASCQTDGTFYLTPILSVYNLFFEFTLVFHFFLLKNSVHSLLLCSFNQSASKHTLFCAHAFNLLSFCAHTFYSLSFCAHTFNSLSFCICTFNSRSFCTYTFNSLFFCSHIISSQSSSVLQYYLRYAPVFVIILSIHTFLLVLIF